MAIFISPFPLGYASLRAYAFYGHREIHNQDGKAVYRKLREGRALPDGLKFVSSYVRADLGRCFQLMETDDVTLFQKWIADWQSVAEFEVVPVVAGKDTREALEPLLAGKHRGLYRGARPLQVLRVGFRPKSCIVRSGT